MRQDGMRGGDDHAPRPAMAGEGRHRAIQHRSAAAMVEAVTLVTDRGFPRHAHDHFGLGVIAFGGHRSWSGVGAVEAGPGHCIMVNPGEIHDGIPIAGRLRGWRMLYIDPEWPARLFDGEIGGAVEIVRAAVVDPDLAALFHQTFTTATAGTTEALAVEEALVRCLAHLVGRHGLRPFRPTGVSPGIALARQRLDEAPDRATTLAELAALAGTSRFGLLRGFKRAVGTTPHAYLLQRRVRLAQRCLAMGVAPAEAAATAGFADQSHLTRAFARQFGVTPGQYRAAFR